MTAEESDPAEVIRSVLADSGLTWEAPRPDRFVVTLPGERKLATTCVFEIGAYAVTVHAFVARAPEENLEQVYRLLLERNLRSYAVAFGVDHDGDIHLTGKLPRHAVTADEVDRVLGVVLECADSTFNAILELGFASSIRQEWHWRQARGESTRNLKAFRRLAP